MTDASERFAASPETSREAPVVPGRMERPRRRGRLIFRLAAYLVLGYLAWVGAMYLFQDKLVFPRDMAPPPLPHPGVDRDNVVTIETQDGHSVEGWFIPAPSARADHPRPAVIFFHGNAEIIDYQDRAPLMWERLEVSVLLVEYRGYGRSREAGKPSERALVDDGVKFHDALVRLPEVDRSGIILHGHSLGGGVAAQVAARRRPAALVLESTFTSIADFAWGYGVPPFLATSPFRTAEVLPRLQVPIFIGHGRHDRIVSVRHGQRLHALVPASTYVELDCGHEDLPGTAANDPYRDQIREFLVQAGVLSR